MSNLVIKKQETNKLTTPPPPPHNEQSKIKILEDLVKTLPNDYDLGAAVRSLVNSKYKK